MSTDLSNRVETLYAEACNQPSDEQNDFLQGHCDDPNVREEVASLLAARDEAAGFFEDAAKRVVGPIVDSLNEGPAHANRPMAGPDLAGQDVGPYRLAEEIGVGGMGVVYRAERRGADFEQTVAIKLLRRQLPSSDAKARFRAEQRVLARLDHPNIARFLDGGVTEGGRPYLVMEHVDGVPITEYAAAQDLDVGGRLDLLEQVFEAVEAAHRQLVVHRDLKPANVLVAVTEEGSARVKLLDFGIAKLLDDALPVTQPKTRTGEYVMTPAYAAPEQICGGEIGISTDVYQLGVLTYELLAGARPFDLTDASLTEIERVLLEETPKPPSEKGELGGAELRGDLDTIVMKCLRKEPERRYRSVEALSADLQRYRTGEPVEARPATLGYRAKKFVRRNRAVVVTGAIIALLVMAYAATVTVQANRLAEEQARAQREAETAEEVSRLLVGLFEASDPYEQPDTLTARALLRRGEQRVGRLQDQPAARAQLLGAMGRAYQGLGDYEQADSLLSRARSIRTDLYDDAHPEVAESLDDYGEIQRRRGQYAVAESLHTEALAMRRRLYDPPHPKIAESLRHLGLVKENQEALSKADSLLRGALAMRRSVHDGAHRQIALALDDLGSILFEQGRYDTADSVYRDVLKMKHDLMEPRHPDIASTLNNLGLALREQGQYAAADSIFRKALVITREQLGSYHPETAATLSNLGITLYAQGQFATADSVYRDVREIQRRALGPRHPDIATTLINRGSALRQQGKYVAADSVFREALTIAREQLGPRHPKTATAHIDLASALRLQGRYEAADSLYRNGLDIRRDELGSRHPETAAALDRLGTSLHGQGRYAEADSLFRKALAIQREELGPHHPEAITTLNNLAAALYSQGNMLATDSLFREVVTLRREALGPRHPYTAIALSNLGTVLRKRGEYEAAERRFLEALSIRRSAFRKGHPQTRRTFKKLVKLYDVWGKPEQAESYRDSLAAPGDSTAGA